MNEKQEPSTSATQAEKADTPEAGDTGGIPTDLGGEEPTGWPTSDRHQSDTPPAKQ